MAIKSYSEDIFLPTGTQIVANTYQIRYGTVGSYSSLMSAATLETMHGIRITPSNYTFAGNPEIEYTDFLLETGLNSVTYTIDQRVFIKFKVLYPNSKEVNIVFVIKTGIPPLP
jgi:hypothetical protein